MFFNINHYFIIKTLQQFFNNNTGNNINTGKII